MWALAWSLLVHGLVLAVLASHVPERARLVLPAAVLHGELLPATMPATDTTSESPVPQRQTAQKLVHSSPVAAVPPAPSFPHDATAPVVSAAAPAEAPAKPSAGGLAAGGETQVTTVAQFATAATKRESDERGPSLSGLRQFRLALALEARRFRRYPEMARRAGLAGTVEVRVSVAASGQLRHAELGRTSGNATLDSAAVEMMEQAAQRTPLPEVLRGREFAVLLPVVFEIEE